MHVLNLPIVFNIYHCNVSIKYNEKYSSSNRLQLLDIISPVFFPSKKPYHIATIINSRKKFKHDSGVYPNIQSTPERIRMMRFNTESKPSKIINQATALVGRKLLLNAIVVITRIRKLNWGQSDLHSYFQLFYYPHANLLTSVVLEHSLNSLITSFFKSCSRL